MIRSLLLTWVFWCAGSTAVAQLQDSKPLQELVLRLQKSKPDTNRIQLLHELGSLYIFNPDAVATDLDSATSIIQQAENLSIALNYPKGQANTYRLFAKIYRKKGNSKKGKEFVTKAIKIFIAHHYLDELGEAYFDLGSYYSLSGTEMVERIRLSELALSSFQQAGNKLKQGNCHKELGDLYQLQGNYSKSLAALKQSLTLYQSIGYPALQGVYDLMGYVVSILGDYKEALQYGLLALKTAESLQDSSMQLCTINNRIGVTYYNLRDLEQALYYWQKALSIAKKK